MTIHALRRELAKLTQAGDGELCEKCGWRPPDPGDRPGFADKHIYIDALVTDDDAAIDAAAAQAEAEAGLPCDYCGRTPASVVVIVTRITSPRPTDEPTDQPPA